MERYQNISTGIKIFIYKIVKRFSIIFICLIGLLYQSYLLLDEYLLGKTVVSIYIRSHGTESLPAITLCLPGLLSMKKMYENYNDLEELFENYSCIITNENEPVYEDEVYLQRVYNIFNDKFNISSISVHDVLSNFSIQIDE